MTTKVVHCKKAPFDIYIGRPSKWGNPFIVDIDGPRGHCIHLFREWLKTQPELLKDIEQLRGKTLGCWCKDKNGNGPCHGDVFVEILDKTTLDFLFDV